MKPKIAFLLLPLALLLSSCSSINQALLSQIPNGSYKTVSVKAYANFGTATLDASNLVKNGTSLTASSYDLEVNSAFAPVLSVHVVGNDPVSVVLKK